MAIQPAVLIQFAVLFLLELLVDGKEQPGATLKSDRFVALEESNMILIAAVWSNGRDPAAFIRLAVDCIGDAESRDLLVGEGTVELDFIGDSGIRQSRDLHRKFFYD